FFDLLRANEVDVRVDAASGEDHAFAGDDLGGGAGGDGDVGWDGRVAGFAHGMGASVLGACAGFDDAPVVEDQRIGNQRVDHLGGAQLALAHAVADHLAAAEFHFFAVSGEVFFDLDPQVGVSQAHLVADGGAEHVGVGLAGNFHKLDPSGRWKSAASEVAHDAAGKAVHAAQAGQLDQFHPAALARLETHGGTGGDVQAHAARAGAIKDQRVV